MQPISHSVLEKLSSSFLTEGEISDTKFLTCLFIVHAPAAEQTLAKRVAASLRNPILKIWLLPRGKSVTSINLGKKKTFAECFQLPKKKHQSPPKTKEVFSHILYSAYTL